MGQFQIGKNIIGIDEPLYFIADIAANHDGSFERALKLIEIAKESGAHAAKFQNFIASKIVSRNGFESMGTQTSHQAAWKKPVFDVYKEASISMEWTVRLKEKCDKCEIEYFSSPYDFESVDHIDPYVNVYKIGSGDVTWHEILAHIASKGKPILIAAGASTMEEVSMAMDILLSKTKDIVLMQCNTNYTADKENFKYINLNVLNTFKKKYPDTVLGLSDHTHGHSTVLGAVALGARVFEKHFTDDNSREGPDHKFAMNPVAWRQMVESANELYQALGDGVKKIEGNELNTMIVQRRCLYSVKDIPKGSLLKKADLFPLRPRKENGIVPYEIDKVIGMKTKKDIKADEYICWEDLETC